MAHATLDTQQLISHTRAALVDTNASLQGSEGRIFSVSEVHNFRDTVVPIEACLYNCTERSLA